ncbi:MAG: transposase [Patescibacteria group bacterium]|nr:transposase [Patescibacteria group bacterium]
MRKTPFVVGEYYHIYSRTILNVPEFRDNRNAERIAKAFLIANSTKSSEAFLFLKNNRNATINDALEIVRQGEKLVDVLCYCIMPDHYHLLLKELKEGGISNFIRKSNISISKYINIKNNRRGVLFESRFNSKHINTNNYLLHLSLYIHLNPLDILSGRDWRIHKAKDWLAKREELLGYPWSSLKTYLDNNHKDLIISGTEIIMDQFNSGKEYEQFLHDWSEESFSGIKDFIIEESTS